jgi:MEMO1 family protein
VIRRPSCAGSVYPADPAALRTALEGWLRPADGTASPAGATRLVVSPHIDYARGAAGYACAARALAAASAEADLFVFFGTAHEGPSHLFTVTRRDYASPLGAVPTDRAVVDALARELGEAEVLGSERFHDREHSVELPLVVLQQVARRPFTALPVLCSSLTHLEAPARFTGRFFAALARATEGRRACFVAGADLAHVGPLYGDPRPATPAEAARVEAEDRRTLSFLASGDAEGFHRDAVRDDERRRLCGAAPIYAAMRAERALAVLDGAAGAELVRRRGARHGDHAAALAAHLAGPLHLDLAPVQRALLRGLLHVALPFPLLFLGTTRPRERRRRTRLSCRRL